jgi:alkanesulfonate monooxygenase SsuD/methylene tetrahydromethanopterin reductase-like flavin-dependent oxidoreductase (luciferase family)
MRFGLHQDGRFGPERGDPARSGARRAREMIEEAVLADEVGFHVYGVTEAHFTLYGTSSPEVILGAVAARTRSIRLRPMSTVLLAFNHPIRVAEFLGTLDCVSDGRAEVAAGRSNSAHMLEAFGISPSETRAQWSESLDVLRKALSQDPFEHQGDLWTIPPRTVFPRPIQQPHPPLFSAATSIEGCRIAGEKGLGVISGNTLAGGWDFVRECHDAYRDGLATFDPSTGQVNASFGGFALKAYCAETNEQALEEARDIALDTFDGVIELYERLAAKSQDYEYMGAISTLKDRREDVPFLVDRAPYLSIGDPEFFIERCRRLEEIGVDEFVVNIDGMTHEQHMSAIELIGRHVIPLFPDEAPSPAATASGGAGV